MGLLDVLVDAYKSGMGLIATSEKDVDMRSNLPGLLADFTPVVGDAKSAYEGVQAARQGDYLGAGLGALGALPFVPAFGGIVKAKTPFGQAKELSRRLDDAKIPYSLSKSKSTKSAYLNDIADDISVRFSDHPSDALSVRQWKVAKALDKVFGKSSFTPNWKDPNYAADVFPDGGHSIDEAEQLIMDLIAKSR